MNHFASNFIIEFTHEICYKKSGIEAEPLHKVVLKQFLNDSSDQIDRLTASNNSNIMPKNQNTKKRTLNSADFKLDQHTRNLYVLMEQTRDTVYLANDLELEQYHISQAQIKILFMLTQENKGMTLAEMSRWILKKFNSVSTLVNKMERNGLVKRTRSPIDSKVYISLTKKGADLYSRISERAMLLIFSALKDEERDQLSIILKKMLGLDYKPPFLP